MFCKKCGKPNPDDASFCSNCGEKLNDIVSSNKEKSLLDKFQELDTKHKKWIYIYLVYALIVFIISLNSNYDKYNQELLTSKFFGCILLYCILIPLVIWGIYYWYQQRKNSTGRNNSKEKVFWEELTKKCPNDAMQIKDLVGDDFYSYTFKDGMYRINSIRYAASETFHCEIKDLKDIYLKILKIKLDKEPQLDLAKEKQELEMSKMLYERGIFVIKTPWEYSFYSLCLKWAEEYFSEKDK